MGEVFVPVVGWIAEEQLEHFQVGEDGIARFPGFRVDTKIAPILPGQALEGSGHVLGCRPRNNAPAPPNLPRR